MPRVRLVSRWTSAGARTNPFLRLIFFQSPISDSTSRRHLLLGDALRHGAHDDAASVVGQDLLHHFAELGALLAALDLAAHAHARGEGHVHQEATGEGDLRGDPRALGADGLLGDLDQDGLPLLEELLDVGDGGAVADFALAGRADGCRRLGGVGIGHFVVGVVAIVGVVVLFGLEEVGGVEERRFFQADVYKGGLDAGENRVDAAKVDVAEGAALIRAIVEQLDEPIVLEDGHAGLPPATIDENFALHVYEPRPTVAVRPGPTGTERRRCRSVRGNPTRPTTPQPCRAGRPRGPGRREE